MLAAHAQLEQVELQVERERERREQAEHQLRWFKSQLFGANSERRVGGGDAGGQQLFLGEIEVDPDETVRGTAVRSHERRRRQPQDVPDEKGLRFDDAVPVETVVLPKDST